jgi:hypothetical protein
MADVDRRRGRDAEATIAAGFAAGKSYVVQIKLGKTVVAKAQLTLRD